MAAQPKKNSTGSSARRKKTPAKNTGAKKRSSTKKTVKKRVAKKSKHSSLKKNIWIVLGVFVMISLVAFGYFLGQEKSQQNTKAKSIEKKVLPKQVKKKKNVVFLKKPVKKVKPKRKKVVVKKTLSQPKPKMLKISKKEIKKYPLHTTLAYRSKKAKLALIIDDVHTGKQLHAIQTLGIKITPSIFPPYTLSPHNNFLAQGLKHYMIHLPMESGNKQFNTQTKTLKTSFSRQQIEARVKELRQLFPTAKYVNNHTGSVFTNDYNAMLKLYRSLRKEGFVFIDSRTAKGSKVAQIAHKFGDAYVARDIFIDNIHNVNYIHKQLRKAVKLAKKNGYAVAIGHPHASTMQALQSAKDILKDVELVYIDSLYKQE